MDDLPDWIVEMSNALPPKSNNGDEYTPGAKVPKYNEPPMCPRPFKSIRMDRKYARK